MSYKKGRGRVPFAVCQINANGEIVNTFDSAQAASVSLGGKSSAQAIRNACNLGSSLYGYQYKYKDLLFFK